MTDKVPCKAKLGPGNSFVWAGEFKEGEDFVDPSTITYDPTGRTYTSATNVQDALTDYSNAIDTIQSAVYHKPTFLVYSDIASGNLSAGDTHQPDWNNIDFDTHGGFSLVNNTYTIPETGVYEVLGNIRVYNPSPHWTGCRSTVSVRIYVNTTLTIRSNRWENFDYDFADGWFDTYDTDCAMNRIHPFTAGDSIEMKMVYQSVDGGGTASNKYLRTRAEDECLWWGMTKVI